MNNIQLALFYHPELNNIIKFDCQRLVEQCAKIRSVHVGMARKRCAKILPVHALLFYRFVALSFYRLIV